MAELLTLRGNQVLQVCHRRRSSSPRPSHGPFRTPSRWHSPRRSRERPKLASGTWSPPSRASSKPGARRGLVWSTGGGAQAARHPLTCAASHPSRSRTLRPTRAAISFLTLFAEILEGECRRSFWCTSLFFVVPRSCLHSELCWTGAPCSSPCFLGIGERLTDAWWRQLLTQGAIIVVEDTRSIFCKAWLSNGLAGRSVRAAEGSRPRAGSA